MIVPFAGFVYVVANANALIQKVIVGKETHIRWIEFIIGIYLVVAPGKVTALFPKPQCIAVTGTAFFAPQIAHFSTTVYEIFIVFVI
ncbi:hypothetical protein D3C85_1504650 [compost metagenome]